MDTVVAVAEVVGLAIYRLFPRRVKDYVEYDSILGHFVVLVFGFASIAFVCWLAYALVAGK